MSKKQPAFEEALEQLEEIIKAIEQGKVGLEASIGKYEEGMKLIQYCRTVLAQAEARIQKLQLSENAELEPTPMPMPESADAPASTEPPPDDDA